MSCKTVCRICLKVDGCGYAQLQSTERSETLSLRYLSLKKKISMYLPELDLNVRLTNPLVMCTNCIKCIQDFHIFKMKYKDTERILRNYIVSYPANCLSEPLDLAKVAQSLDSLAYNESSLLDNNFQSPHDIKPTIITSHSNGDEEAAFGSLQQYSDDLPHLPKDKCHDTYNELFNIEVCDVKLENIEKEVLEKANITKTLASIDRRNYPSKYYCKNCNRLFNSQNHYTKHNCGIIYSGTELKFPSSGFLCLLCNKTASSKDKLRIHFYRNHKKKSRHKCKACFKSFRDNYYLAIHMRVHTGERPYECEICHKGFTSSYTYSRHCKSIHSIKGVYKCSICSQTFRSRANLRQHECKHRLFECDICFEEFLGINVLKSHRTKKHNISDLPVEEFSCLDCQRTFATKEYLAKHSCIHNGEKYECDVCTKRFTTRACLKVHIRVHSEEQPYQCDICGKTFGDKGVLERHILTHSDDKPYVCDLCPKQYTNKSSLTSHKFSHSEGYTVKCFVCSKQVNKGHLKIHLRIHTGEKPFECEVCFKRFVTARALRRHMVVHTKEKQFKCDICYKLYSTIDTLKIHQRIHTVGKPFQCDICGSFFSEKNSVKRHRERKHNNLRFECEICTIKFPTKREWKTHKLLHNPYECDVCQKQFPSIQRFNAHKKIHSDDKPHKCDICQKLFRHMIHLQKHKRVLPEGKSRVCKVCKVKFEYSCESNTHKKCLIGN